MKKLLAVLLSAALTVTCLPVTAAEARTADSPKISKILDNAKGLNRNKTKSYKEGEAIAVISSANQSTQKLRCSKIDGLSGVSLKTIGDFSTNANNPKLRGSGESTQAVLVSSDTMSTDELVKKLKKMDGVEAVSPNYILRAYDSNTYNDTYKDIQWNVDNKNAYLDGDENVQTNVPALWNSPSKATKEPVIAVIDTGIDYKHEELADKMWVKPESLSSRLSGTYGYDFVDGDSDPMDENGHGTHCAGIIAAAQNNSKGISGVSSNAKIMALRFLDFEGYGMLEGAVKAYDYVNKALDLNVNIVAINCSWGGEGDGEIFNLLAEKVGKKGALTVAAAGNESVDSDKASLTFASSPYIVNTASMNNKGELSTFSNYGKKTVDLAAPGSDIISSVSENTFAPVLYTSDQRQRLCNAFYDGGTVNPGNTDFGSNYILCSKNKGEAELKVSYDSVNSYNKGGKAIRFDIKNANPGGVYALMLPFEGEDSEKSIYGSMMVKYLQCNYNSQSVVTLEALQGNLNEELGNINISEEKVIKDEDAPLNTSNEIQENCWNHYTAPILDSTESLSGSPDKGSYLMFVFVAGDFEEEKARDYSFAIDQIGVSKANVDSGAFGKYDIYSGTSMAAPFVSGCAALLYDKKEEIAKAPAAKRAALLRKNVLANVHKSDKFSNKLVSGGYLDVNTDISVKKIPVVLSGAAINKSGNVVLSGQNFGKNSSAVDVKFAGSSKTYQTAVKKWSDTSIELDVYAKDGAAKGPSMSNRSVEFTVRPGASSTGLVENSKTFYLNGYKPAFHNSGTYKDEECYIDSAAAASSSSMYFVRSEGPLAAIDYMEPFGNKCYWETLNYINLIQHFSGNDFTEETEFKVSDPAYHNGKLWFNVTLDQGYYRESKLFSYDINREKEAAYALPPYIAADSSPSVGVYNGEIWLVGGLDLAAGKVTTSKNTYIFTPSSKKWRKGPALPTGRYASRVLQTGASLTVSLGYEKLSADNMVPATLIYNGSKFISVPMKSLGLYSDVQLKRQGSFRDKEFTVYKYPGTVGICKDGLVFAGLPLEGMADTFTLNVKTGKFASIGYSLGGISSSNQFLGASLDSRFYLISLEEVFDFSTGMDDAYDKYDDESEEEPRKNYQYKVLDIPISSGMLKVTGKAGKGGRVSGTGKYMPGSTVTLQAVPSKNYVVKSFKVNGKASGKKKTFTITADTTAEASFGIAVKSIKLNTAGAYLIPGKSLSLKASVAPANAWNKKLKWTSSNTKYATVNASGKVTAKSAGVGKTVTITALSQDGSGKKAVCKVYITKKASKLKISKKSYTLKRGKSVTLKVSVSPSSGTCKKINWKSNNTKYATVNSKGKVTAKKAGKGKTVTITGTLADGSGMKVSCKIKIN